MVEAVKHFRCYLYGRKFSVITDHRPLKWLLNLKDPTSKLARWQLLLSSYDFEIIHRQGRKHGHVDALSRAPQDNSDTTSSDLFENQNFNNTKNKPTQYVAEVKVVEKASTFLPSWDRETILEHQKHDKFCQAIMQQLDAENDPELNYYVDNDGILYKRTIHNQDVLVVPKSYIRKALHDFHDLPFCGHFGQQKTLSLIRSRLFWPSMQADIIKYCKECVSCSQRKTSPHLRKVPLVNLPEVLYPFERTSMDICGPFVTSYSGNKYLLTFQDYFSKYVEAVAIPDQKAETIARVFVTEIIGRHGTPKQLLTDQGPNFVSAVMKNVCQFLNVDKLQTTPYHPQSNGMIERSHRVFKDIMSHYVAKSQQDWDTWVPYVLMAYRFHTQSSTGYSPYFLLHGRDPVLPFDNILKPQTVKYDTDENYVSELMARLNSVFTIVRANLSRSKEKQAIQYNKTASEKHFTLGQLVYLHDPSIRTGLSKKLEKPWTGPYRVVEIKGPVTYKLRKLNGRKELIVHANRLKLCHMREQEFSETSYEPGHEDKDANLDTNYGIDPEEVTRTIMTGVNAQPSEQRPAGNFQRQEAEAEQLGTIFRDGVRVTTRPHRPPKRFTFSEFD